MGYKTMIIDGDKNKVLEIREGKDYPINKETFDQFEREFGKKVVFSAANNAYGKPYNVFILESKQAGVTS